MENLRATGVSTFPSAASGSGGRVHLSGRCAVWGPAVQGPLHPVSDGGRPVFLGGCHTQQSGCALWQEGQIQGGGAAVPAGPGDSRKGACALCLFFPVAVTPRPPSLF